MSYWSWKKLWILLFIVPFLTACPPHPKLSLPSQGVQGGSITASLEGLNGEGAKVTVAGLEATVTAAGIQLRLSFPRTPPKAVRKSLSFRVTKE
jgi:hypothetical protein